MNPDFVISKGIYVSQFENHSISVSSLSNKKRREIFLIAFRAEKNTFRKWLSWSITHYNDRIVAVLHNSMT
jgi:hypothetical protein